ncbi:hypothetical protein PF005_g2389 [Phytophthora fragariae]|uniref:Uncharacterized protein n=1 Tax=Phytophthora fragariae TaxID=53985 RepID=A0A6A4AGB5_9STRA|nr:hypothetical protein PF003_g30918 [Phytophthora fragariae]KAE8947818.1 hypothetical protein PF009_g2573 [Phytophthora fragariae]KAE9136030.1 hypothetical protein PF007_g2357 [Phytophthora fragariae]KAE9154195.1 hypothetical protein PF006_g1772 [Phytophthora fragariae]KAE9233266.1 hypothetical protein PF005_g2389 [Phytophthora fragariae]
MQSCISVASAVFLTSARDWLRVFAKHRRSQLLARAAVHRFARQTTTQPLHLPTVRTPAASIGSRKGGASPACRSRCEGQRN